MNSEYQICISGLKQGSYKYHFDLDDSFFEGLEQDEILAGKVAADIELLIQRHTHVLKMYVEGNVTVICDRCLEPMSQYVQVDDTLLVRDGLRMVDDAEYDYVEVDERGYVDLSWPLYELIETCLPIVNCHQAGECNPQMEELLQSHSATAAEG